MSFILFTWSSLVLLLYTNFATVIAFTASQVILVQQHRHRPTNSFGVSTIRWKHVNPSAYMTPCGHMESSESESESEVQGQPSDQFQQIYDSSDDNNIMNQTSPIMNNASVKKKKKNSQYTISDNRDSLPFLVRVITPDPYTNHDEIKQRARANTNTERLKQKDGLTKSKKNKIQTARDDSLKGESISASIFTRATDGSLRPILGEFFLDKSTNCGDFIRVGDREYIVQKATCQFKYTGGKKFVMVRKILEVKETVRVLLEQMIQQNFDNPSNYIDHDTNSQQLNLGSSVSPSKELE